MGSFDSLRTPVPSFFFPDPLDDTTEERLGFNLDYEQQPFSPSLRSWSVVDDSDALFEDTSEADITSVSLSSGSSKISRSPELLPAPLSSDVDSASVSLESETHSEANSDSRNSHGPLAISKTKNEHVPTKPPTEGDIALASFLSRDFLKEIRESALADSVTKAQGNVPPGPQPTSGHCPQPGSATTVGTPAPQVSRNVSLPVRVRYRGHNAFCQHLLRRRKVHSGYLNRELDSNGRKPGPDWRWCGFSNCRSVTCRYGRVFEGQKVLRSALDDELVAARLLAAFQRLCHDDNGLDAHVLVAFAASPPIMRAMACCVPLFFDDIGEDNLHGITLFMNDFETAAQEFESLTKALPFMDAQKQTDLHREARFSGENRRSKVASDVVLRFMMHAEAWRRRQAEEGFPWNWSTSEVIAVFCVIISTYRCLFSDGHMILEDEAPAILQEREWRRWFERYRPWNDCKVQFLRELEPDGVERRTKATAQIVDAEDREEPQLYEGVGLHKGCWWPSRP